MSVRIFCLIVALVCFVAATLGLGGRFSLTAAGLAFVTAGELFG